MTDDELRVMVVDDATDLRFLIALLLEDEPGWNVVGEAGDGAQAVALARELEPHLVLLDAAMPVMDGLEALPLLRSALPHSLLVMVTAFPRGTLETAAAEAGADACLDKMRLVDELVPALRGLVAAWSPPSRDESPEERVRRGGVGSL